jgi:hypothetical protein
MLNALTDDEHGVVGQPLSRPRFSADQAGIALLHLVFPVYPDGAASHSAIIEQLRRESNCPRSTERLCEPSQGIPLAA